MKLGEWVKEATTVVQLQEQPSMTDAVTETSDHNTVHANTMKRKKMSLSLEPVSEETLESDFSSLECFFFHWETVWMHLLPMLTSNEWKCSRQSCEGILVQVKLEKTGFGSVAKIWYSCKDKDIHFNSLTYVRFGIKMQHCVLGFLLVAFVLSRITHTGYHNTIARCLASWVYMFWNQRG